MPSPWPVPPSPSSSLWHQGPSSGGPDSPSTALSWKGSLPMFHPVAQLDVLPCLKEEKANGQCRTETRKELSRWGGVIFCPLDLLESRAAYEEY